MAAELNGNTIPEKQSSSKPHLKGNCKGELSTWQSSQLNIMAQCTTYDGSISPQIIKYGIYLCLFFRFHPF